MTSLKPEGEEKEAVTRTQRWWGLLGQSCDLHWGTWPAQGWPLGNLTLLHSSALTQVSLPGHRARWRKVGGVSEQQMEYFYWVSMQISCHLFFSVATLFWAQFKNFLPFLNFAFILSYVLTYSLKFQNGVYFIGRSGLPVLTWAISPHQNFSICNALRNSQLLM